MEPRSVLKIIDAGADTELIIEVLRVSAAVLETRVNKNLAQYNSLEHLHAMIASDDLRIVSGALAVLLALGRYRNKSNSELEKDLQFRLTSLAQGWGLYENKINLVDCCFDDISAFPEDVQRLQCDFFLTAKNIASLQEPPKGMVPGLVTINEPTVDPAARPADLLTSLVAKYHIPLVHQFELLARIKLCQSFASIESRRQCLRIRLVSFTVLLLSHAEQQVFEALFEKDPDIIPELVKLVGTSRGAVPIEIKISCFRMLQAFVQSTVKVQQVIDATGAGLQHGFLPQLLQQYTALLLLPELPDDAPISIVTSIFTLVQLLCNYQPGVDALVASDTIKVLLPIIRTPIVHVKFSTRSARILEMILHMSRERQRFIDSTAVSAFVDRLAIETSQCLPECRTNSVGFLNKDKSDVHDVLESLLTTSADHQVTSSMSNADNSDDSHASADTSLTSVNTPQQASSRTTEGGSHAEASNKRLSKQQDTNSLESVPSLCIAERKSLLKALLKFLLSVVQEPTFATAMRTVIEGSLLNSLEIIIRNLQYFGTTLWSSASKWVTEFCNNEPSLLHVVQDAGIHEAFLEVLKSNPPPCADILADLPNLLSAICLNERGLALFRKYKPRPTLIPCSWWPAYLKRFQQHSPHPRWHQSPHFRLRS